MADKKLEGVRTLQEIDQEVDAIFQDSLTNIKVPANQSQTGEPEYYDPALTEEYRQKLSALKAEKANVKEFLTGSVPKAFGDLFSGRAPKKKR